ncbi:hypothetical protein HID58_001462, partial [Brassica napus]
KINTKNKHFKNPKRASMEESQQEPQERGKGLSDSNGLFSKFTVERRILPTLNQMHGSTKTFQHYSNRMKILKTKYLAAAELLRFSSGFGWDATTKRFTAPDEVWTEYIKAHPNYKKFRDETFEEFDDLKQLAEARLDWVIQLMLEQLKLPKQKRNNQIMAALQMILWKSSRYERDKKLILFIKLMIHPFKKKV